MIGEAMNGGVGRECWGLPRRDAEAIAAGDTHRGTPTMIGAAMNGGAWTNGGAGRVAMPKPSPPAMACNKNIMYTAP